MSLAGATLSAQNADNVAYQDNQVRFTVVTDGVIRLEWEPDGKFTDLPSFVASERDYPEVDFKVTDAGKKVQVTTSKMVLTYKKGTGKFTKNNLEIKAVDGFFTMYEDAGNDKNYATEYATTLLSNCWNGNTQTVTIAPRTGSYEGMPAQRNFKVKVVASAAPESVTINGQEVSYEYDGYDFAFTVDVPVTDCAAKKVIVIRYDADPALADSIKGLSRRMSLSIEALKFRTNADPIDELAMLGTINEALLYYPEKAHELTGAFMKNYTALREILKKQPRIKEEDIEWFLRHCGYDL